MPVGDHSISLGKDENHHTSSRRLEESVWTMRSWQKARLPGDAHGNLTVWYAMTHSLYYARFNRVDPGSMSLPSFIVAISEVPHKSSPLASE